MGRAREVKDDFIISFTDREYRRIGENYKKRLEPYFIGYTLDEKRRVFIIPRSHQREVLGVVE